MNRLECSKGQVYDGRRTQMDQNISHTSTSCSGEVKIDNQKTMEIHTTILSSSFVLYFAVLIFIFNGNLLKNENILTDTTCILIL